MSDAVLGIEWRVAGCQRDLVHRKTFFGALIRRESWSEPSVIRDECEADGGAKRQTVGTRALVLRSRMVRRGAQMPPTDLARNKRCSSMAVTRPSTSDFTPIASRRKNVSAGTTIRKPAAKGTALSYVIRCVGAAGSSSEERLDVCGKKSNMRRKSWN